MSAKFKLVVCSGMNETELDGDSLRVYTENGQWLELYPRKSDGEITLYASGQLIVRPHAANCVRVESIR